MEDNQRETAGKSSDKQPPRRNQFWPILLVTLLGFLVLRSLWPAMSYEDVDYGFFLRQLEGQNIQTLEVNGATAIGTFKVPPEKPAEYNAEGERIVPKEDSGEPAKMGRKFFVQLPEGANDRIDLAAEEQPNLNLRYSNANPMQYLTLFLLFGVPIILLIVVWMMFRRTRDQIMGGGGFLSSFSRSTAKRYEPSDKQMWPVWKASKPTCKRSSTF